MTAFESSAAEERRFPSSTARLDVESAAVDPAATPKPMPVARPVTVTKTSHQERLEREAIADRLRELADQLGAEDGDAEVAVGNKTVRLSPADRIAYEIDVREKSSFLRGSRESIELELEWTPD